MNERRRNELADCARLKHNGEEDYVPYFAGACAGADLSATRPETRQN